LIQLQVFTDAGTLAVLLKERRWAFIWVLIWVCGTVWLLL